ncbi:MAG: hypothetical protein ACFCUU_07215 [Cyclobacteriaceae bacterium]
MKTLRGLIIGLVLVGQNCTPTDNNFNKVLNSPDNFHGKEIEMSGIMHEQFEDVAIYSTNDKNKEKALWVDFKKGEYGLDGKRVKLKGEFDKKDKGHLGQYFGVIKSAELIED